MHILRTDVNKYDLSNGSELSHLLYIVQIQQANAHEALSVSTGIARNLLREIKEGVWGQKSPSGVPGKAPIEVWE